MYIHSTGVNEVLPARRNSISLDTSDEMIEECHVPYIVWIEQVVSRLMVQMKITAIIVANDMIIYSRYDVSFTAYLLLIVIIYLL